MGRRVLWLLLAGSLLLVSAARAQTPEATISGIITDATRGVVPGVTVTAINLETGQHILAVSNQQGFYVLRPVPIGRYISRQGRSSPDGARQGDRTLLVQQRQHVQHERLP